MKVHQNLEAEIVLLSHNLFLDLGGGRLCIMIKGSCAVRPDPLIRKGDAGVVRRDSRNISSRNLSISQDLKLGVSWVKWSGRAFSW